jgi:hypothetical protein
MLREVAPDRLWVAEMPHRLLGIEFGARMTVIRLRDGNLWLHSPIRLDDDLKRELDARGPVRYVVAPNTMHYLHLAEYKPAYPQARFYALPRLERKLTFQLDGVLQDKPAPEWADDLEQTLFRGSSLLEETIFHDAVSRTLILTDLCFNLHDDSSPAARLMTALLGIRPRLAPSRMMRLSLRQKAVARAGIDRILQWEFERVIVAHGDIVESGGKAAFREAFAWLKA